MVTSTAGLTCDTTSSNKTSESQSNGGGATELSDEKSNSDNKTNPNTVEKLLTQNNDVRSTMSADQTISNPELSGNPVSVTDSSTVSTGQTVEPQTNGLSISSAVIENGPGQTLDNTGYSNYGPYGQRSLPSSVAAVGKSGSNIPSFQPPMQARFPVNQPSSSTPTLNQLLATPSRFPINSSEQSGDHTNQTHTEISRTHRQLWEQDQRHQRSNVSISEANSNSASLSSQPPQQPEYFPPHQQPYPPTQPRYPLPAPNSKQMPPYNQSPQYNPSMPPPPSGAANYSQAIPTHPAHPYQNYHNSSQQPYYGRHPSPAQGVRMDSQQVPPQHPPDSPFQHSKERMMSPNRKTPQPAAVPSPMSAGSSPRRQGSLSSIPQFRGQSPSRASPALSVTSNTPLSPNLARSGNPQLSPSIRGSEGTESNKPPAPSAADLGYPTNYRPTVPQSPYSVQTPNPQQGMMSPPQLQSMMSPSQPQGMMSPSHGSYSGSLQQQQQLNVPGMQPQEPVQSPAPVSGGKPLPPSQGAVAQSYTQTAQPSHINQQPGYSSASPRPAPAPGSLPPSVGDPGQTVRRGAAAAAAAAMAAAAHSAQPGHVPGQRPTAPAYYGQTAPQQQARTPHPNYSNVQAGSDMYQQQKPYRQMTPSRMPMPGAPHQMSGPGAQQRMHPPSGSGYRHPSMSGPPEQYPGYYPPGGQSQTPSYQSTLGGYSQQHQPQEPATKKPLARSLSQKLASLFEPPEPGRREFIEAVLRYWEEKEIPLKNAPLMGRKTLDLFRLYDLVRQNGGMQEVTTRKKWPEISSILGLGTTSTSGFTLKKQYCKYLYGYECKERGLPEPQEAMARMTEANRKSRKAIEAANEEARLAAMPPRHIMQTGGSHHPYPPQNYPPGQYPQTPHYRPPPQQPPNQGYMMPRAMTPSTSNTYPPGHPNHSGGTIHHTRMPPPPQNYPSGQPISSSYGQQQAGLSSIYPPASVVSQPPMTPHPPASSSIPTPNKPFVQQPPITTSASISLPVPSTYPPPITSTATFSGRSLTPNSSFGKSIPSAYPQTASTPTSLVAGATPPLQSYQRPPYDSYRAQHPGSAPAYPSSNSPLPQARPTSAQGFARSGHSPSPKPGMYSPRSSSPLRPPQPRTPNFPSTNIYLPSTSPGLKRPGTETVGPPNKIFRHDTSNVLSSLPPSLRPEPDGKSHRRTKYRFSSTLQTTSTPSSTDYGTFRASYPQRFPQYRMNNNRYPIPRTPQRWPQTSMSTRPYSPLSYSHVQSHTDPRARRPLQIHRTPMAQQFKREYMQFPSNSVEATPLRLTKFQRKSCNNVGLIESWRIIMALKSGLLVESSWALNVLNVFLYDQNSVAQFRLNQLPGLLDAVVDHYRRHLCEIFTLPHEQEAIGVKPNIDTQNNIPDTEISEDNAILRQIRLLSKKTTDRSILSKLNSKCNKSKIKIEPKRNPFIIDKSCHWDLIKKTGLHHDIGHIVVSMTVGQRDGEQENSVKFPSEDVDAIMETFLEEILSIPCTVLWPDVYDVTKTSIDIMRSEEAKLDEKLKVAEKELNAKMIKTETKETQLATPNSPQTSSVSGTQIKIESKSLDVKPEMVNGSIEADENTPKPIKSEPVSSPMQISTKANFKERSKLDPYDKEVEPIKNNMLLNGKASHDEMKQNLQKTNCKLDINCKMEIDEPQSEGNKPQNQCKQQVAINKEIKNEPCKVEIDSVKKENETQVPEIKKENPSKNFNLKLNDSNLSNPSTNPKLLKKVRRFLEDRNVLLLEDEAFGRDGSVPDPLSGPLLSCKAGLSRKEMSKRLGSVSNILRSLSFIPKNHTEFCKHQELLRAISGILLLRHKHKIKRKRKLDFESVEELKEKVGQFENVDTPTNYSDSKKSELRPEISSDSLCKNVTNSDIYNTNDSTSASSKLFAPETETVDSKTDIEIQKSFGSSIALDDKDKEAMKIYGDLWWWDSVQRVREDALVILSNISSTLDLSLLPDDRTPLCIVEACLHLALCPSSDACDSYSSKPRELVSPQRLALEILTKLSIKDENVQLILAVRPFCKLEKLFAFLIRLVCDRKDQALQEFAIVLLSNLSKKNQSISRVIALQKSSISCLITFLEACEETGNNNRDCLRLSSVVTHCGSTEFMMTKAAMALLSLASVAENKPSFLKYHLRLLALSMSQLLGKRVTAILSSVLFEVTHETQ